MPKRWPTSATGTSTWLPRANSTQRKHIGLSVSIRQRSSPRSIRYRLEFTLMTNGRSEKISPKLSQPCRRLKEAGPAASRSKGTYKGTFVGPIRSLKDFRLLADLENRL